jgi:MFS family permease
MPVVVFSCLGHLYIHLCMAFYFVIILALEVDWRMPYHELLELWTLGALMIGAVALPAGMLGDRIGAPAMMVVFFLGIGACSILAGFADSRFTLFLALTGIGVFASIYHPVGIPWLVRSAGAKKGKALGFNGIFGSLGTAVAGVTAGALIDLISWRAAFIVPGLLCVGTGVALLWYVGRGSFDDEIVHAEKVEQPSREDRVRVFVVLLITMFFASLIYNSTQTALPKTFELRHNGLAGDGAFGIGMLVAAVYVAAGAMQLLGGHLADRHPLKYVYLGALVLQVPLLWLAASQGGFSLVVVAMFMVMANVGALPAENMLLAAYTPARRHGLVFGLKFVLAFGVAPLAIQLVAFVAERTGEFYWLFVSLSLCALMALSAAVWLPRPRTAEFEGRISEVPTQGLQ